MDAQPLTLVPVCSVFASPNRSATPRFLRRFLLGLALTSGLVCGFSFLQGNVLAPVFAVFELALVVILIQKVWAQADAEDRIVWDGEKVRVTLRRGRREATAEFHPYWMRLERRAARRAGDPPRLWLGSHGRLVEVGSFLSGERRTAFAGEIVALLENARAGLVLG